MAEKDEKNLITNADGDPPDTKKDRKDNKNKPDKKTKKSQGRFKIQNWKFIDSLFFIVIVLIITAMMVFAALAEKDVTAEMDFQRTDEYSTMMLRSFVSGTHAKVNYSDYDGAETVYSGWSSRQLIIEDVRLRENLGPYKAPANIASIEDGIESSLRKALEDLTGDDRTFSLNISWQPVDGSTRDKFFRTNGRDANKVNDASRFTSRSKLEISVFDPGQTEIGDMEIELTLTIYDI